MKRPIRVSDHAIVRWLERAGRFDLEFIRAEIRLDTQDALNAGAKRFTNKAGLTYALDPRTRTVITVMDDTEPNGVRRRKRTPRDFRETE